MGLKSVGRNSSGQVITNADISSGNHFVSGQIYTSLSYSIGSASILITDRTYCIPYYGIDPITAAVEIAMRVTTAGTTSAAKFGIATLSSVGASMTATMITTLNPTGVATNTLNTTVLGTFGATNLKGHQFYLLCVICGSTGGGTVMPTVVTGTSSNLINWATGVTPSSFGQFVNTGWTSADNTYAGGV